MENLSALTFTSDGVPSSRSATRTATLQMLQYTDAGESSRLLLLLRHDDAEREYVYDRESRIGHLDKALDEATARDWLVVSMQKDFKRVFPLELLQ